MSARSIVIFDSGVGGFSILRELTNRNHNHPVIYLADQGSFPYGDKSPDWIKSRLTNIANWTNSHDPAIFILACNTATVIGVEHLRSFLSCPVVAVEPVVKPLTQYHHPLLLATTTTLQQSNSHGITTLCPKGLVQAIEDMDQAKITKIIASLDQAIQDNHIDAIGLSCTHYPLVSEIIAKMYPNLTIIDPSIAVVDHFSSIVELGQDDKSQISYFTTGNPTTLTNQVKYYLDQSVQASKVKI